MIELDGISIAAIACNVPKNRIDNLEVEGYDSDQLEKIVKGTGVRYRHSAPVSECTSDYCIAAASRIINDHSINVDEIGVVVLVTQSADYVLPATSCIIQDKLGLSKDTLAFDVNLGCSGYVYGLSIVGTMLKLINKRYALLLAGDTNAGHVSPQDQSALFLFGDSGTATLLERTDIAQRISFEFGTDGSGANCLIIKDGAARNPMRAESLIPRLWDDGNIRANSQIFMDGMEIFNFAISTVVKHVKGFMDIMDNYDSIVFHQANYFMLETMRKLIKIPKDKFLYSLQDYGNTSSASIPVTICQKYAGKSITARFLLCGFGVGLSWASADVKFSGTKIHGIEEGV